MALAARNGPAYFPTPVLTIADGDNLVVIQDHSRSRLGDIVEAMFPARATPYAVLIGGYAGVWMLWDDVRALRITAGGFDGGGPSLGAGIIRPVRPGTCGLAITATLSSFLAAASAGQCGPCRFGLRSVADLIDDIASCRAGRKQRTQLARFLSEINGRGACGHPDSTVRMIATALGTFRDDLSSHVRHHRCQQKATR